MRVIAMFVLLLAATVTWAASEEICGNPCPTGFVWTDKDMGKCVPVPPKTS